MGFGSWFLVGVFGAVAVGTAPLLRPLWLLSRRDGKWPSFIVWAVQVALTASVPVVILASWGRVTWYAPLVAGLVLSAGVGYAWSRRRNITYMLRGPDSPESYGGARSDSSSS